MLKPFVKWTGSKRSQANEIISYIPNDINVYFEPFLGSGAILGHLKPKKAVCSDVNKPLIDLWNKIKDNPEIVTSSYKKRWEVLQDEGHTFFYKIRDSFNKKQSPLDFLFLTRTCVNGLIRYNQRGEFNNSLHHTRKGMNPESLGRIISEWSQLIQPYKFINQSYEIATKNARPGDFVYLDPPYFNTGTRYFGTIDYDKFINYLDRLNKKGVKYALSYDGKRGEESFIVDIPKHLYKRHIMLHSGNSTFNKIQNKKVEKVYESLYLNY
ncbi:MAG: DNA adenine methylase [Parcubacteria group bacterium CG10_big_fil_rev_8_21_14_0_10_41_35]|nr:MAG: DNA adenine methylase [Parcubacteria group bacterium CG10_big_fil_rev_8_21_14_0_10_41_35]